MSDLKPCPNPECNNPAPKAHYDDPDAPETCVDCYECDMTGPWAGSQAEAIRLWNLLPRTRWVGVDERLPESNGSYLVCGSRFGEDDQFEVSYIAGAIHGPWDPPVKPTHWLDSVPDLPTAKGGE